MSSDPSVTAAFAKYVNLAARELEHWLGTEASAAARGSDDGASVLRILRTAEDDRTDDDLTFMRGVVERITAERDRQPEGDLADSPWRHGLMNRGHDPMTWSPAPLPAAAVASAARAAPDPRPGDPPGAAVPGPARPKT